SVTRNAARQAPRQTQRTNAERRTMLDCRLGARVLQAVPEIRQILFSNSSTMPNWNNNQVIISASEEMVREYITEDEGQLYFNMHLLFPDRFEPTDLAGHAGWDYDWAAENT
ncbi:MAG: hypothetical protein KDJ45_16530, partial [Hyphomicrobiaceae bacterium]|nr:hypothetical protein [Hyphomicrobiaceae bacterium]